MGKIKEFYHEEIMRGQMEAQRFLDEEQRLREWAETQNLKFVIYVNAPDVSKLNDMINLAKRQIEEQRDEGTGKFPLPNGFNMSYSIKKVK